jgi:hypothetical protein
MTTTGPLPIVRDPAADDRRLALLDKMGARSAGRFSRYRFPTADAVIDPVRGVLFIAVDIDPDPADWSAVVGLIRAVGFTDGTAPHPRDPGEPEFHGLDAVYTWRLEYAGCIWCDGKGTCGGCPLCGKDAVVLSVTAEPRPSTSLSGRGSLLSSPAPMIVTWYHERHG